MAKSALDILKEAILLERRGKAFYSTVARQTESEAARKIFEMMAAEEDDHINYLSKQFAYYQQHNEFMKNEDAGDTDDSAVMEILSQEIKNQVEAAGFEAAAISAAMDFETRAVKIYSDRAEAATDPHEKEMYQMLADWEKGHHYWLHKINEDLKEQIWYDNNFWPF
ncbi:MAG: ferritin family protein [Bacteroidales bacterium]|nr:ferritin family protein [Bacteroidales bacterium]